MDEDKPVAGAQSLRRSLQLLRLLAAHQEQGLRLHDAITLSGLERSTTHRLLRCLGDERFAERDAGTKRWRLGIEAMQLGFACLRHAPLVGPYRPAMQALARQSGDTVFLLIREGDECLCLHREEGPFPVKVFTIAVGGRRLLGLGAGGLALLAGLRDDEVERIVERRRNDYRQAGIEPGALRRAVARTRARGWAEITDTITPGVSGVGVTLRVSAQTLAAISIGAITPRLTAARKIELATLMQRELSEIEGTQRETTSRQGA